MSAFDLCYCHQKRRRVEWLKKKYVLVTFFLVCNFDHKSTSETRHSEMTPIYDPQRTRTKPIFSGHLYRAVFDESGIDRMRALSPIDPCWSRQKRWCRNHHTKITNRGFPLWHSLSALAADGVSHKRSWKIGPKRTKSRGGGRALIPYEH